MGLLDEAIREHLELKRRSGADPSAVAREEREALAPVLTDSHAGEGAANTYASSEAAEIPSAQVLSAQEPLHHEEPFASLSAVGQETAELDMQAVMEEDPDAADGASPVGPIETGPTPPPYSAQSSVEDGSAWEAAREQAGGEEPAEIPGQERLTFE
jgi:hypothetical protein